MKKPEAFSKSLAIAGSVLVWLPIILPLIFGLLFYLREGIFMVDYLMPAELFIMVLSGGCLLLWASIRARAMFKVVVWGLAVAVGILAAGMVIAQLSGLASGAIETVGLWWSVVVSSLVIYILSVITMGVGGILLILALFRKPTTH